MKSNEIDDGMIHKQFCHEHLAMIRNLEPSLMGTGITNHQPYKKLDPPDLETATNWIKLGYCGDILGILWFKPVFHPDITRYN
jgi:hypothetical protein